MGERVGLRELDDADLELALHGRRRHVVKVWIWLLLSALVAVIATMALAVLLAIDIGSSFFDNDSPPLPDEARVRLERVRSSSGFSATPSGATETDSGMSDHSCFDWFDGGEPRVWRTLDASGPAEVAARIQAALVRDGWSAVDGPPTLGGVLTRDFGVWVATVEVATDPSAGTVTLVGVLEGTVYCQSNGVD